MITINTRVRPATLGDARQMTLLLNEIIAIGGTTAHVSPFVVDEMFSHYIAPEGVISSQVAISNGQLSGFQFLRWANTDEKMPEGWAIIATFVSPDRAKMGIGQKLFAATKFAAKEVGVKTIDATIRGDNVGGLKYYGGLGFTDYKVLTQVPLNDGTRVDRIRKRFDF